MSSNRVNEVRSENLSLVTVWKQMSEGVFTPDEAAGIMDAILAEKNRDELQDMIILLASQMAEAMDFAEEVSDSSGLYQEYCALLSEKH